MKKGLFLFTIILSLSCLLYAQENTIDLPPELPSDVPASVSESDDYKLAQRYREMAIEAHEAGDYEKSIEYSKLSKEYSAKIISKYGAYQFILDSQKDAERKLSLFKGVGGDTNELTSDLYGLSVNDLNSANNMLNTATNAADYTNTMLEYNKSSEKSELGYNVLSIDLRREYLMNESVLTNGDSNDMKITSLRDESKNFMANGDYTNSLTTSRDAMSLLDQLEAPLAYAKAQEAMDKAKQDGLNETKANVYNEASKSLSSAGETLIAKNYSDSLMHSKNVISLVNIMETSDDALAMGGTDNSSGNNTENVNNTEEGANNTENNYIYDGEFPQYYVVQLRKTKTDSLWRIASYDFIYGDGNLWRKIYEANKDKIKNPNVITEGQILTIPSLKGETRSGTYDPNKTYSNINNAKQQQSGASEDNTAAAEDNTSMKETDGTVYETTEEEMKQADNVDETIEVEENTETAEENTAAQENTAEETDNAAQTE